MSNEFYIRRLQVGCSGRCVQLHRPCRSCQNCRDRKALASVPLCTLASLAMRATQGNLRVSLPYLDELPTATFSIPAHPIASLLRDSPIHVNRLRVISLTRISTDLPRLYKSLQLRSTVFLTVFLLSDALWIVMKSHPRFNIFVIRRNLNVSFPFYLEYVL